MREEAQVLSMLGTGSYHDAVEEMEFSPLDHSEGRVQHATSVEQTQGNQLARQRPTGYAKALLLALALHLATPCYGDPNWDIESTWSTRSNWSM